MKETKNMKRKLTYFSAPLLLVLLVLVLQLSSVSQTARAGQDAPMVGSPEEKCERECSDRFEECASVYGAVACRPAFDLCRQDSPKGNRHSGRRPR